MLSMDTGVGTVPTMNGKSSTDNHIPGVIELRTFLGPFTRFHVHVDGDTTLTADIPNQHARSFETGQRVVLSFAPDACQVLPIDSRGHELKTVSRSREGIKAFAL